MQTILLSVLTGVCFGLAMFLRKMAVSKIGLSAFIFEAVIEALLAIFIISTFFPFKISQVFGKINGVVIGILAGLSMGIGVISFYLAARSGPVILPSLVSPVLGSLLASVLAILFIGESLSFVRLIGLVLSLSGLYIFLTAH